LAKSPRGGDGWKKSLSYCSEVICTVTCRTRGSPFALCVFMISDMSINVAVKDKYCEQKGVVDVPSKKQAEMGRAEEVRNLKEQLPSTEEIV
jgi:hypothetical protein